MAERGPLAPLVDDRRDVRPPARMVRLRQGVIALWLVALAVALGTFFFRPEAFTAERIAALLVRSSGYVLLAYLLVSILRAVVLIPSTPFVLAGSLLLPGQPLMVLAISMAGIALSATLIYFFSDALGFNEIFRRHSPQTLRRMERALDGRRGFLVLAMWSFFPLVPTDLACYVAGSLRMNFWKLLAAVCLGELVIVAFYVGLGQEMWTLLTGVPVP